MGWKGDHCWHCRADLPALMALDDLPEEWQEMREAEFERHMTGACVAAPRTDFERKAAESLGDEYAAYPSYPSYPSYPGYPRTDDAP